MALHSMEMTSKRLAREFDFVHTTALPPFHQSNGLIETMVKKVNNAYRKTDDSPTAQARAFFTPIMGYTHGDRSTITMVEILHRQTNTRCSPFKTSKMSQHETDSSEIDRNPECPKRAL